MSEIEDVPGEPEDERRNEDDKDEHGDRERDPAGDERPDPEDAQDSLEELGHGRFRQTREPTVWLIS
jgi:hypothetical protein